MPSPEKPQGLGQVKALLVGINTYLESSSLSCCAQDAVSLRSILADSKYGMNDKNNINLMIDSSDELNKPIRNNIINNIRSLTRNAQDEDTILFFFAGHGMDIQGEAFLLPSDFRQETGVEGGISVKTIKAELASSKAKCRLMFLDACHSGSVKGRAETGKMTRSFLDSLFPAPEGFAILSSCNEQEYSYEWPEKKHGVFTFFMLEGLEGKGDENADGFVDILELHHYVTPRVQKWAFHNQKVQTPVIDAKFSGILALTKAAVSAETSSSSIGKSEVTGVILVTRFEEMKLRDYELGLGEATLESLNEDIGKIRANLLLDFKPSQFDEEDDKTRFPGGWIELRKITNEYRNLAKFRIELNLDYSKKNREATDRVLNRLDDFTNFWTGIGFKVKGLEFDLDKLVQICTDKGYEVKKFQKKPQYLEVQVDDWTNQLLKFHFVIFDGPFIGIDEASSSALSTGFYTILNPTNILEVFKSTLIQR